MLEKNQKLSNLNEFNLGNFPQVIRNGTSSPEEDDVSDITDSDDELEKDVTDQKETFITKTTTVSLFIV